MKPSDSFSTTDYYQHNAQHFFDSTAYLELPDLWARFEKQVRQVPLSGARLGGEVSWRVLDAGCGSGRDSLHFMEAGFQVVSVDASAAMCELAQKHTGQPVRALRLEELDYEGAFEGVWCCAAALHVARAEIQDVLYRLHRALVPGGVCYLSFKYGDQERLSGGRRFLDMNEAALVELLEAAGRRVGQIEVLQMWQTRDARPERADTVWLNCLSRRSD